MDKEKCKDCKNYKREWTHSGYCLKKPDKDANGKDSYQIIGCNKKPCIEFSIR